MTQVKKSITVECGVTVSKSAQKRFLLSRAERYGFVIEINGKVADVVFTTGNTAKIPLRNLSYYPRKAICLSEGALNFDDIPIQEVTDICKQIRLVYKCPKCHGHGRWNLKLNAYGKGEHFQQSCFQCNGWGYVDENNINCIHVFKHYSNCKFDTYQCEKCGKIQT